MTGEAIESIPERRAPFGLKTDAAGVVRLVSELLQRHCISHPTLEAVTPQIDEAGYMDAPAVAATTVT